MAHSLKAVLCVELRWLTVRSFKSSIQQGQPLRKWGFCDCAYMLVTLDVSCWLRMCFTDVQAGRTDCTSPVTHTGKFPRHRFDSFFLDLCWLAKLIMHIILLFWVILIHYKKQLSSKTHPWVCSRWTSCQKVSFYCVWNGGFIIKMWFFTVPAVMFMCINVSGGD